jgi:hypothetical protein
MLSRTLSLHRAHGENIELADFGVLGNSTRTTTTRAREEVEAGRPFRREQVNSTQQELDEITCKDKRNNGLIFDYASELHPRAPPATPTSTQGRPSTTEPPAAIASATSEASGVPPERHKEPSRAGLLLQQKSAVAWPLAGEGGWPEAALHGGHRGPRGGE